MEYFLCASWCLFDLAVVDIQRKFRQQGSVNGTHSIKMGREDLFVCTRESSTEKSIEKEQTNGNNKQKHHNHRGTALIGATNGAVRAIVQLSVLRHLQWS
jgi:hypothetical protein